MKIGAIVQARMNSERFPGKVLRRVQGKALLQYLLECLSQCGSLEKVVVATSVEHSDDPVALFCRGFGVDCYRGPLEDVAKRFLEAAEAKGLDVFVRISGDSPLLDFRLVDQAVEIFRSGSYDLVTNVLQRTYPRGQSVEVVRVETLKRVYPFLQSDAEREHVTPYFYAHRDQFSVSNFESGGDYGGIHGQGSHKYENVRIGINGRLDRLQAAILHAKFEVFPKEIELRQKVATSYSELLSDLSNGLVVPHVPPDYQSVWAQYSILAKDEKHRSELQNRLKEAGIPTAIYYPKPLHLQSAFKGLGYNEEDFPVSEDRSERIFSLPMHPYLTEKDQQQIVGVIGLE